MHSNPQELSHLHAVCKQKQESYWI